MLSSLFVRRNRRSDSDVERCSVVMWSANVATPEMSESQLSIVGDARILRNMASDLVP